MKTLVLKYLANTISEEELLSLKLWLKKPENRAYFKEVVKSNQELDLALRHIDSEKAYRRILEETSEKESLIHKIFIPVLKYAAVITLLIATTFFIYTYVDLDSKTETDTNIPIAKQPQITLEFGDGSVEILDENSKRLISNKKGKAVVVKQENDKLKYEAVNTENKELIYNRLTVPFGKRFEIELSDGTVVQLNAGTKLKYPVAFTDPNSRDVYLEGEAFFSVQKNPDHPFIVHTKKMNVRVLGTKFNVSSYENEDTTSTVLLEGSVKVLRPNENNNLEDGTIISPNQQAAIQYGELSVEKVDVEKYIAWTQGVLYFANDRFADIVKELERHYNIKILNNFQELNSVRYTGTFKLKTISQVLEVFKKNTKFEYEMVDDSIIIKPSL
ncbi:FecR domain-containing protein [Arenibacter sp. BSSL-BM3]|uniref:FecR domain-containing protein n=1 Tax=Arenibacter arenosicollis TaxID=2762274 RepID=A0ABR7QKN7_9FLAO|nr:FecR domain-containing protein [Arenibacter arenosicollis]MBC8767709.1 FecR domain-containing protein [Arenibacter arenosicollis]